MRLRGLSLFSGVGGLDLAFEAAGGRTVGMVEIDPYCRRVLARHWPYVPCLEDIRDVRGDEFGPVDLIMGGFPCQDISAAGKGAGIDAGERSGLWSEFARLIGVVRPRYVVVENVAALLGRGLDRVCGDLAALGYDATWGTYGASAVGAPHRRERVFIVGMADTKSATGWAQSGDIPAHVGGPRFATDHDYRPGGACERRNVADTMRPGGQQESRGAHGHEGADARWSSADDHLHASDGQDGGAGVEPRPETLAHAGHAGRQSRGPGGGQEAQGTLLHLRPADGDPPVADAPSAGETTEEQLRQRGRPLGGGHDVADAARVGTAGEQAIPNGQALVSPFVGTDGRTGAGGVAPGVSGRGGANGGIGAGVLGSGDADPRGGAGDLGGATQPGVGRDADGLPRRLDRSGLGINPWPAGPGQAQRAWEPPRLAEAVRFRVSRLKALGNAVVPTQALPVFQAIMMVEKEERGHDTDEARSG